MSTLLLYLPLDAPGTPPEYSFTLTHDGHTARRHGTARAALLPDPGRTGEVVAVVPARALSWQRVTLPPGALQSNARLRTVLEGLLEERLLDDPSQVHFALAPGSEPVLPTWVAVCNRPWLTAALNALEAAGRPASRIVPEFAPGPSASGQPEFYAIGVPEDAQWVTTCQGPDQAVTVLPLSIAPMALAQAGGDGDTPPTVRAEPTVASLAEKLMGRPVQIYTASERALDAGRSDWDLAQLDLARNSRTRALRMATGGLNSFLGAPQWRAARWALGIAAVAMLVGLNVSAWQENQSLAAKQAGVRNTLSETFPHVKVVVDAPVQMAREVALLRQASGTLSPRDLEPLMAAAGAALPAGLMPNRVEFSGSDLRLGGLAALTTADIDAMNQRLHAQGYSARMDNQQLWVRPEDTP